MLIVIRHRLTQQIQHVQTLDVRLIINVVQVPVTVHKFIPAQMEGCAHLAHFLVALLATVRLRIVAAMGILHQ